MRRVNFRLNSKNEAKFVKNPSNKLSVLSSAEDSSYFEPLLIEFLAHFTSLMELYQAEEEEK